jgi:hypothetical protein
MVLLSWDTDSDGKFLLDWVCVKPPIEQKSLRNLRGAALFSDLEAGEIAAGRRYKTRMYRQKVTK